MNKKIIIDIKSEEDIKISQKALDRVLETATENLPASDCDAEISFEDLQRERQRLFSLFDSGKDKDIYKKIVKTSIKDLSPLIIDKKIFSIADLEELRSKTKDKELFLGLSVIIYILKEHFLREININKIFDEKELAYLKKTIECVKRK